MRLRTRLLVGTTAVAVVLGAALAPAPAEDTFPSWRYPASLQSGYRLSSDAWTARVSSSGQWVLFTTVDWENLGAEKLYLRDRWTDRTTYLADVVDGRSTTMSDNGRFVTYWATDASTTIRDLTGGATVTATGSVMAINNDGYYLTRSTGAGPSRLLAGRVLPGGQREPERVAARGDLPFRDVTPSLEYAVAIRNGGIVRVSMTTGDVLPGPGPFATPFGDARISPDGRWVASMDPGRVQLLLWDTTTGQTWTRRMDDTVDGVLAVTNTGYVFSRKTRFEIEGGTPDSPIGQIRSIPFGIDVRTALPEYRLALDWASGAGTQLVAGDIDRIIVCTTESLIPIDTNRRTDCYLRPFPPSPLAG